MAGLASRPPRDDDAELERHRRALHADAQAVGGPSVGPPLEPTHYACLGLDESATPEAIAAAAARWAPGGPAAAWPAAPAGADAAAVSLAVAVLSDARRKQVYDAWLARERERRQAARHAAERGLVSRRVLAFTPLLLVLGLLAWWLWPAG